MCIALKNEKNPGTFRELIMAQNSSLEGEGTEEYQAQLMLGQITQIGISCWEIGGESALSDRRLAASPDTDTQMLRLSISHAASTSWPQTEPMEHNFRFKGRKV